MTSISHLSIIISCATSCRALLEFIDLLHFECDEDSFSSLGYQTCDHLLSNILRWIVQQLLQLVTCELLNDLILSADHDRILRLELLIFVLLLEHVLDESSPSVSHLAQSIAKSFPLYLIIMHLVCAFLWQVRHVPYIVRNELLYSLSLVCLHDLRLRIAEVSDQARHILYQDIVTSDHHLGWLLSVALVLRLRGIRCIGVLG